MYHPVLHFTEERLAIECNAMRCSLFQQKDLGYSIAADCIRVGFLGLHRFDQGACTRKFQTGRGKYHAEARSTAL
jgi:hypothetical protein